MDMIQVYKTINNILDTLNFDELLAGFHKYRFALYNSKEIILDGKVLPPREDFRGNTAREYEGEYIAIWNMDLDPVEDMELLAAHLVHEIFHCHQLSNSETRFPSDFELLNYPDDLENFTKKYNENRYLADAYEKQEAESLRKFVCLREERRRKYPSMVAQEMKMETLEGMAEYISLKALKRINEKKYNDRMEHYLGLLREESKLLFDVRRSCYYSGAVYFLCLEKLGVEVKNAFGSPLTAFEQNVNAIDTAGAEAKVQPYDFIERNYTELLQEKELTIKKHMESAKYTECHAFICGYDPMNMFRVEDLIYCKHFVCLNENGEVKTFTSAIVLKLQEGSNQSVTGYYI